MPFNLIVNLIVKTSRPKKTHVNHGFFELSGGDGGIRTLDTLFKVCSFSKRVPSAARPRLRCPVSRGEALYAREDGALQAQAAQLAHKL